MLISLQWLLANMSGQRLRYLLCYDIRDPKRLRRVHRTIRDWGFPIQFSVFEVELTIQERTGLVEALEGLIEASEDKIRFYHIHPSEQPLCLGLQDQTSDVLFV